MPRKTRFLSSLVCFAAWLVCFGTARFGAEQVDAAQPNVIVVMADDLGIGDVSPTNPKGKIRTPHLQRMADQGMTFFDAHTLAEMLVLLVHSS